MTTARTACLVGLLFVVSLAGCASATAPSPSAAPSSSAATAPPTDPPPTQVPGGSSEQPSDGGGGGGGGGTDPDPGIGQPVIVVPQPGAQDPHPVPVDTLEAQIDGRKVVILATWWSGIAPCTVLESVAIKNDGNTFTISVREGIGDPDAMCIEIAQQKATGIDLGELDPGEYTVIAQDGTAGPLTFTVS